MNQINNNYHQNIDNNLEDILTIFYDGACPLCCAEMELLLRKDSDNKICLIDIHSEEFVTKATEFNVSDAMKILHGTYQGELLLGLAVTHRAWTLVGKGFLVAPLNWPIVKPLSHQLYLLVAKHRQAISSFLAKVFKLNSQQCNKGTCYDNRANPNSRGK